MPKTNIAITPPKTIKVATQLLWLNMIAAFLSITSCYVAYKIAGIEPETYYPFSGLNLLLDSIIYFTVVGLCIYNIIRAKNWARWLYVIYVCAHMGLNLYTHTLFGATMIVDIFVVTYLSLRTISITLLFTPDSNRWFRGEEQLPPLSNTEQNQQKRPTIVSLALQLQWINMAIFIAGAILACFFYRNINQPLWTLSTNSTIEVLIDTPIHLCIMTIILIALYCQKGWARTAFLFYFIYRLLFHFYTISDLRYPDTIEAAVFAFFILNFISLTLLYCPSSNRWLHQAINPKNAKRSDLRHRNDDHTK
ncbi:MAG: hypothetical protein P1U40_02355 [Coxiellaceae bacterium]|nr:hypothetical protein [Coxiellaceae bacterium]